jgi:hypothetical protein
MAMGKRFGPKVDEYGLQKKKYMRSFMICTAHQILLE